MFKMLHNNITQQALITKQLNGSTMPSVFLSHTSIDKPFVEKLARDLNCIGIDAWVDKYEIKVGESIFWRVEEGLRESEYFAIVLSPEALASEWVRSEIAVAWDKKMLTGKNAILPLLYRDCKIPVLLKTIKYADFRYDYQLGFSELASVFGIDTSEAITEDTWRLHVRERNSNWRRFRDIEFQNLVTQLCAIARKMSYSVWTGPSSRPYTIAISATWSKQEKEYRHLIHNVDFAIRMNPKDNYHYYYAEEVCGSPRHIPVKNFNTPIGSTANEALEFVYELMERYIDLYGSPDNDTHYQTTRYDKLNEFDPAKLFNTLIQETDWDQGKKLP